MKKGLAIVLLLMLFMSSGCGIFDMVLDASYQSGKRVLKENLPILKNELFEEVEKLADDTLEKAKSYAREKTEESSKYILTKVEARSGVPAPTIKEGEGIGEAISEMKRWWADTQIENERRRLENERRRREGEPEGPKPLKWYEMLLYGGLGSVGMLGVHTANKRGVDRRIGGFLRNVGVLGNGNGNGAGSGKTGTNE